MEVKSRDRARVAFINIVLVESSLCARTIIPISLIDIAFFCANPESRRFVVRKVEGSYGHFACLVMSSVNELKGFLYINKIISQKSDWRPTRHVLEVVQAYLQANCRRFHPYCSLSDCAHFVSQPSALHKLGAYGQQLIMVFSEQGGASIVYPKVIFDLNMSHQKWDWNETVKMWLKEHQTTSRISMLHIDGELVHWLGNGAQTRHAPAYVDSIQRQCHQAHSELLDSCCRTQHLVPDTEVHRLIKQKLNTMHIAKKIITFGDQSISVIDRFLP